MNFEIENTFTLPKINTEKMEKDIGTLNTKRVLQNCDISTKTIKENSNIFSNYLCAAINISKKSQFLAFLKTDYFTDYFILKMSRQFSEFFEIIFQKHNVGVEKVTTLNNF